jgi:hypothetical protein
MIITILANENPDENGYKNFQNENISNIIKNYLLLNEVEAIYIIGPRIKNFSTLEIEILNNILSLSKKIKYSELPKTNNIGETLKLFLETSEIPQCEMVVCDTNGYFEINNFVHYARKVNSEICCPVVNACDLQSKNWILCVADKNYIKEICLKNFPSKNGFIFGMIGVIYFKKKPLIDGQNSIIEYINDRLRSEKIDIYKVNIKEVSLQNNLFDKSGYEGTIFCDLDGTLIYHEGKPDYKKNLKLLPGAIEFLDNVAYLKLELILCTARNKDEEILLKKALLEIGVKYSKLIMGISSGPRILINDLKQSTINRKTAIAIEVIRDNGLTEVSNFLYSSNSEKIAAILSGASGAQTYLVKNKNNLYEIKKEVIVSDDKSIFSKNKLIKQYDILKAYHVIYPDLCPNPYDLHVSDFAASFRMPYYENIRKNDEQIIDIIDKSIAITELLSKTIYCYASKNEDEKWIEKFLKKKILSKLNLETFLLIDVNPSVELIINNSIKEHYLYYLNELINNNKFFNLVNPKFLGLTHGDCTVQNSIFNNNNIILIDFEPESFLEPKELDLGKLFQSIYCGYELWEEFPYLVKINSFNNFIIYEPKFKEFKIHEFLKKWSNILNISEFEVKLVAKFYLSTHLIRMIPYQQNLDKKRAIYAYLLAVNLLSELCFEIKK